MLLEARGRILGLLKLTIDCWVQFKEQAKQQVFVDPWSLWYSIAVCSALLLALIASQLSASRNQLLPAADFFSAAS
jgi:hypothetical protein